ncbi:MAG: adenosylcobinamide amidohydrolase [Myxococcales bacterium]|nr:adenosylcobinamide amidohydrolase [Myxococcales bacterium]
MFDRMVVVSFGARLRVCSWAVLGGGVGWTRQVAWIEVRNADLPPSVDPRDHALARLRAAGVEGETVGLLTSRRVTAYELASRRDGELAAHAVATVGLGNALRAGDAASDAANAGTINLLVAVSTPLTGEGLLEATAIATEAKTAAVLEAGVLSRSSGKPATGSGTDCTVFACRDGADPLTYAGKHTRIGALVGAVAYHAVREGVRGWLQEHRESAPRDVPREAEAASR